MAGERLLKRLHQRGGSDSDYCDLVTGTVISTSPLRVQLSNDMIIDDNFITLGKAIGKRKIIGTATIDGKQQDITITVDNSLQVGDEVALIRSDGGQEFYLFERGTGEDAEVDE